MAGKFLLRGKDDTDNPVAPRCYHLGITAGRNVFYLPMASGNRTGFIAILAEGARFTGDTGIGRAVKVLFAGFEIPEFDSNGARNWKLHKGTIPTPPNYKTASFQASTEKVLSTGHGLNNDDPVAFHARQVAGVDPVLPAGIETHKKYFVVNKTANDLQIAATVGGAVIPFDVDSSGDVFLYKANVGLFDAEQGIPEFFPTLKYNFAGLSYLEILLPADLSNGEDEPTKLKVMIDGKLVYDFQESGTTGLLETVGDPITAKNPALISFDILRNDGNRPAKRFHAPSWLEWRDRAAAQISWIGGNTVAATPAAFDVLTNVTYDGAGTIEGTGGVGAAFSPAFSERNASAEAVYNGGAGDFSMIFTSAQTTTSQRHGIIVQPSGTMYFTDGVNVNIIGSASPSDRLKVAYEYGVFKAYKNNVPLSLANITVAPQAAGNFYIFLGVNAAGQKMTDVRLLPSGTNAVPRMVDRYTGGFVILQKTPIVDVFEAEIALSAGVSWQDVDGEVVILPRPDRAVVETFNADPNSSFPTNCKRIAIKRRPASSAPNYYRYSFRDLDDAQLTRKFVNIDRPNLRSKVGYIDSGMLDFGVMTQSQIERIGETKARLNSDLDYGWTVEGFLDTIKAAKGDFVHIIDPASGFTEENPALAMIISETLTTNSGVETRNFETTVIVPDFYSDSSHGQVVPLSHNHIGANFLPPPPLESLELTETARYIENATVPVIEGVATFAPTANQTGVVFRRFLGVSGIGFSLNPTTNELDNPALSALEDAEILFVDPTGAGYVPTGLSGEKKYILRASVVNAGKWQLEDPDTSSVVDFSDLGGAAYYLVFPFVEWTQTTTVIVPDPATRVGVFAIENASVGVHQIKVLTRSAGGISESFLVQATKAIIMTGDLSAPTPPTDLRCIFDGALLRWEFAASASPNVVGYQVTDENGKVIDSFRFISLLGFTETAKSLTTTRRVYAVSRSGVRSASFAALTFSISPKLSFLNTSGASVALNGIFTKTAATGWGNCGASLNYAVLTNRVVARLAYTLDTTDQFKVFGFARTPLIDSYDDFHHGIFFKEDGNVYALWRDIDDVLQQLNIDVAAVGVEYAIKYIPQTFSEDPQVIITKTTLSGTDLIETVIHTFDNAPPFLMPLFAGVALYTIGTTIAPNLELSGDLVPTVSIVPTFQNAVNITDDRLGMISNADGHGAAAGCSSVDTIAENTDGEFSFSGSALCVARVGLNTSDPDQDYSSMLFGVQFNDDYSIYSFEDGAFKADLGLSYDTDVWTLTRENQQIVVRKNGQAVEIYEGATDLTTVPLLLDIAFGTGGSFGDAIFDIRFRQAIETSFDGDSLVPLRGSIEQARVGENYVYEIPKFAIASPTNGQVLGFMDGEVVNLAGLAIGATVIGANLYSALFVDSSGNLAQDSSYYYYDTAFRTLHVPKVIVDDDSWNSATWLNNYSVPTKNGVRSAVLSVIPSQTGNSGKFLTTNGSVVSWATITATVSSVGLSLPSIFSVSGSPVTTSGTLTATLASQTANRFFASPNGSSGAPTFRAIVAADLGSGSPSSANWLSGALSWSNPLTIGNAVGSGTNNYVLFISGGNLAQSQRLQFDGTDLTLVNPTAATSGVQTQNSPYIFLTGQKWRTDLSANEAKPIRISNKPNTVNQYPNVLTPTFMIEAFVNSSWNEFFSIKTLSTDYLTTRYTFANPDNGGWGGMLDVYYDGSFAFKTLAGGYAAMFAERLGKDSTYAGLWFYTAYYPEIRSHYGGYITLGAGVPSWAAGAGAGATGSEWVKADIPIGIGLTSFPSAKFHVLGTTEQMRFAYDASNYGNVVVSSAALITLSGSSGAKYRFDKAVERIAGAGSLYARIGGVLFSYYASVSSGTSETAIYSDSIAANTLNENGASLRAFFVGHFSASAGLRYILAKFAGTVIFNGGDISETSTAWKLEIEIIRTGSTTATAVCHLSPATIASSDPIQSFVALTGLDFTTGNTLELRGNSDNAGDVLFNGGKVFYCPA